ncbi:uncharacterized protein LOC134420587 [Melospiza melodia melodia]|uniref:uncharacterized protein LOC134420587 n=1 Tax=Melospiza melodia melodia TaxID=1914991 RepID=UPI002FD6C8C6
MEVWLTAASQVKLMNQGAIDAPFTCLPSATNLGLLFKFAPEEGIIAAGGSQAVQISFRATVLGSFEEELQFSVAGSPRPAILTIKLSLHAALPPHQQLRGAPDVPAPHVGRWHAAGCGQRGSDPQGQRPGLEQGNPFACGAQGVHHQSQRRHHPPPGTPGHRGDPVLQHGDGVLPEIAGGPGGYWQGSGSPDHHSQVPALAWPPPGTALPRLCWLQLPRRSAAECPHVVPAGHENSSAWAAACSEKHVCSQPSTVLGPLLKAPGMISLIGLVFGA